MRYYLKEFKLFTPKFVTDDREKVDTCIQTEGEVFNIGTTHLQITDLGDLFMITKTYFKEASSLYSTVTKDWSHATRNSINPTVAVEMNRRELTDTDIESFKDTFEYSDINTMELLDIHNASDYPTLVKDSTGRYYLHVRELINE